MMSGAKAKRSVPKKANGKYRALMVEPTTADLLEAIKRQQEAMIGFKMSWNDFFTALAKNIVAQNFGPYQTQYQRPS
jgi:hypothetical protein